MEKKIFVLGASRLQVPFIKRAKELGMYVYVLDYDPKACGIQFADEFLEISTIEAEKVLEAAERFKPDFIVTSTSDMPVRTVSYVCEKLGMKTDISYEGALIATNKYRMRERMKECNVPIPHFFEAKTYEEFEKAVSLIEGKVIIKPEESSASRGVVLVEDKDDLSDLYEYVKSYSKNGEVLVEEYMEGPEVSVEAFSIDGEPHIITITDKLVTPEPYFVEIGHTEPSRLDKLTQEEIRKVADSAIRAIGMMNGPTHTEIKVTKDGPKLVEVAARLGGDFITSRLVPLSTGVDMIDCSCAVLEGRNPDVEVKKSDGAAIRFLSAEPGRFVKASGIEKALNMNGVQEIEIYVSSGDEVHNLENSMNRIGHIIATGRDADEAEENVENALNEISIEIEE